MEKIDSIELIEENLTQSRITSVCQSLSHSRDRIWGISIRNCVISDNDFEKLLRSMKKCKQLRYLNLNLNFITTNERLNQLTTLLTGLNHLDTLCLHSSNLKDDGLKLLYYSLVNLKGLRSLDIGDCGLTDKSVDYIREFIHRKEHHHGLSELILSSNPQITPDGWSKILISVASSTDLKYLYIDYNNLDDQCGYLIVAALCSNHAIEIMDLEQTRITNKTAMLLAYLLKNYKNNLKSINLMMNDIEPRLLKEIGSYINNPTLEVENLPSKLDPSSFNRLEMPITNVKGAEVKMRDQLKIGDLKKLRKEGKNEYENLLERDFKINKVDDNDKKIDERNDKKVAKKTNDNSNELLETYEDMRFKTHYVMS